MALKTCERLIKGEAKKLGNHYRETESMLIGPPLGLCKIIAFYYHETPICKVNQRNRTFFTTNGGWNTSSTTRAINSYRQLLTGEGYREVSRLGELAGYEDKNI